MDSKNNFLEGFKNLIAIMDEEYLIGISNKGILNRSKKDLEKIESLEYEINDNNITIKIDEIQCVLEEEIKNCKCSCPSRNICKHIIIGFLYLIKNRNQVFGESKSEITTEKIEKKEFVALRDYSIEEILKEIGEKDFQDIIRRIDFGVKYEILEGAIVKVDFLEEEIIVKLLDDIENSICSCKSSTICRHKAEALVIYKLEKEYITFEELKSYEKKIRNIDEEKLKLAVLEIKKIIEEIMITGLARASESTLDKINNMAVVCHNYYLPNFEKRFRDIAKEISLYFNKNASFTKERLLKKLTILYRETLLLEETKDFSKLTNLIGEFKSSYYEIPAIELHGVGSETWISKSGYEGTTYYFYENNRKMWFTYTEAMPTFYDNKNERSNYYRGKVSAAPWELNCKIEELSKITFNLVRGKINAENRLSSSKESKGNIIGKSNLMNLDIRNNCFSDWEKIIENIVGDNEKIDNIFLQAVKFGEVYFNNIEQIFKLPMYDEKKQVINIKVQFSKNTKSIIRILERLSKKSPPIFFGKVFINEGELCFYPITYYENGEVCNLT